MPMHTDEFPNQKVEFITCFQFCCCIWVAFIHEQDRNMATTNSNGKYAWVSIAVPSVRKESYGVHLDSNPVSVCIEVVTLGVETRSCFPENMKLHCVNIQWRRDPSVTANHGEISTVLPSMCYWLQEDSLTAKRAFCQSRNIYVIGDYKFCKRVCAHTMSFLYNILGFLMCHVTVHRDKFPYNKTN
jgi:hypothetical protein